MVSNLETDWGYSENHRAHTGFTNAVFRLLLLANTEKRYINNTLKDTLN